MAEDEKKPEKNSQARGLDKKMKTLSKAIAKQVSIFYKEWFETAEGSSMRKTRH